MAGRRTIIPRFTDDRGRPVALAFPRPLFPFGWLRSLMSRPMFVPEGYRRIHVYVKHDACPVCDAFSLIGVEESPDGMIECPECGAAWRADRRSARVAPGDHERRSVARQRVLRHEVLWFRCRRRRLDYRGRPTALGLYRPRGSLASDYELLCHNAAAVIFSSVSGRGLKYGTLLMLAGFGLFFLVLFIGEPTTISPWCVCTLVLLMAGCFGVGLLLRSGDAFITGDTVERETLARGLCPACWELLSGIEPDPDGATPCPECGAAWRVPPPTRGPPLACPRCRYSLAGLPQEPAGVVTCPECGEVIVGVR